MKKNILIGLGIILVFVGIFFVNKITNDNKEKEEKSKLLSGKHYVEIKVKDYGAIDLELDADTAPITVTNFIDLVNSKFYDGLVFHRIIENFMVQGGRNTKVNANTIKGEFKTNGVENNISHVRGVISMARADGFNNSASSEFFIVHKDSTFLDGNYAAFGKVTSGMEVVDEMAKVEVIDNNGTVKEGSEPVIESIRVIDNK